MFRMLQDQTSGRMSILLDRAGVCISVACLVQCLVLPLVVVATPVLALGIFGDVNFHLLLLTIILPVSTLAFLSGWNTHRNARMLIPGLAGLAILVLAATLGHHALGHAGEVLLTSAGGILLITGHLLNLRDRRRACLRTV